MGTSQSIFTLSLFIATTMISFISFSGMLFCPTCKLVIAPISEMTLARAITPDMSPQALP
jgi:hypothetical protein